MAGATDPAPDPRQHAVAVLRDVEAADAARRRLRDAGIPPSAVSVGQPADRVVSQQAEMRDEVEQAWISPQVGVAWPKEGLKGTLALAVVGAAVGTVLMVPLVLVAAAGWALWTKLVLAVVVGSLVGGTIAVIAGAAAARGPAEPLAAEVGVTVRVAGADARAIDILRALDPIRLDVVLADGTPVGETVTEEPDHSLATMKERLAHQRDTDWSDVDEQRRTGA